MEKTLIKISLVENNIVIHNEDAPENDIRISENDKNIRAIDIYKLLNFSNGNKYEVDADGLGGNQSPVKDYYDDVVNLMKQIINEINEIEILPEIDTSESNTVDEADDSA